jgi:hypothetical protein
MYEVISMVNGECLCRNSYSYCKIWLARNGYTYYRRLNNSDLYLNDDEGNYAILIYNF